MQAWSFIFENVERARPFSFCKGHFLWGNLTVNWKLLKGTKANTKGQRRAWPQWRASNPSPDHDKKNMRFVFHVYLDNPYTSKGITAVDPEIN